MPVRVLLLSICFGVLFFVILLYVRRYLLRALLSYQGWLCDPPGSRSLRTTVWGVAVRLMSGYSPSLYSYQASLPKMSVPPLRSTLRKLIESLKPLYGPESEEIKKLKEQSKEFERTIGNKLQQILILKSWWAPNYVTDWWEKYIYLMNRSSLLINSNYYGLDYAFWSVTSVQCARAAVTLRFMCTFKRSIDREQLPPLVIRNTIPICMAQYGKAFSTTRVPKMEFDELRHYGHSQSKHIVVLCQGRYYKVTMFDNSGKLIGPVTLQNQLEWILQDSSSHPGNVAEKLLPSLTTWDRVNWSKTRRLYFSTGKNKQFLDAIETAIMMVILDDIPYPEFDDRAQAGLMGNGCNLWCDKSISMKFSTDGRFVVNVEHSWGDAPVLAHILEYLFTNEILHYEELYDDKGNAKGNQDDPKWSISPVGLKWDLKDGLEDSINEAYQFTLKNIADVDLHILPHLDYGKGFIKTCKTSPDAYVQIAIQLASYRLSKKFSLTYEASMTRLYSNGRTETVRSLTQECVDFILAMSGQNVDRDLKIRMFRKACDVHQNLYRQAMAGHGIDRHLFALYVIGRGLGYESEFLQSTLLLPWTLSTSQQPMQQMAETPSADLPQFRNKVCPGGGFGPVSDNGYGISYMFSGNFRIFFHISSKKSNPDTDSNKFAVALNKALNDLRDLFENNVTPANAAVKEQ